MKQLLQSTIFRLLSELTEEKDIFKLEESCDEFALKLLTRLQIETNPMELYYSLGFVHLKLAGIGEHISGEQGKKCLKNYS
jgi:hypothetical protein